MTCTFNAAVHEVDARWLAARLTGVVELAHACTMSDHSSAPAIWMTSKAVRERERQPTIPSISDVSGVLSWRLSEHAALRVLTAS
jgi:hypothetical protein